MTKSQNYVFCPIFERCSESLSSDAVSEWADWALAQPEYMGFQLTLFQPGDQIMPTTLLLPPPDLKT